MKIAADEKKIPSATGIVLDYRRRNILPDQTHQVADGTLRLWIWCNSYVAEFWPGCPDGVLRPGQIQLTSPYYYLNLCHPEEIAVDLLESQGKDIALLSANPAAALGALGGSVKSAKKAASSAANGAKGGRPRKVKNPPTE